MSFGFSLALLSPSAASGSPYTLTAEEGTFALTGQTVGLLRAALLDVGQGSFALTGQDAGLFRVYTLVAAEGSFALTGQDAGLLATRLIVGAEGSFALTGQNVILPLAGALGSFTLTGQDVTLTYDGSAHVLTADAASFALTGQDAGLALVKLIVAAQGAFALSGQDSGFLIGHALAADVGSLVLSGQDIGFSAVRLFEAEVGSLAIAGQEIDFATFYPGAFTVTGLNANIARVTAASLGGSVRGRLSRGRGLHVTPPLPLVLPTGSTIGRDGQVASARLINAYAEDNGEDAKARYTIYAAPGRTRWDTGNHAGGCRGLIELDRNNLIAVQGNEILTFEATGASTSLGTLVGSARVQMARNRRATPQIGIVTDVGQYYILESGTLTQVVDTDLPASNSIDYLDGFFLYGIDDGRIFASDLENGLSIQADAFEYAKSDSSKLRRVKANAGYLYVFKERGAEIWQADASLAGENFPFRPVQQDIDIGISAPHSVSGFSRGLGWIDDEGIVRFGRDGDAQRISSHTVERAIQDLSTAQLNGVYGFSHTFQGHETYVLRSARWTWAYSVGNQKWYERSNRDGGPWAPNAHAIFNGRDIVGNEDNGQLHYIDTEAYRDGGDHLIQEIWCAQSHRFPNRMIVDAIEIDAISGVGLNSGDAHNDAPQLMVDYSDNGGKTFHGERMASLGAIGEYTCSIRLNRWGQVNEKGRIWRLRASAAVLRGINQVALSARPIG